MRGVTFWSGSRDDLFPPVQRVLDASGARLRGEAAEATGAALGDSLRRTRAALRTAPEPPPDPARLRELDLAIRIWPIRSPGGGDMDLVIVSGEPGTEAARIAHAAFSHAAMNARRTVTLAAGADAAFRSAVLDAARDYPALEVEEREAGSPIDELQVVVCPDSSSEAWVREAVGRLGGADRAAAVRRNDTLAVFEPLGGGGSPVGLLVSIGLLLEHLNEHQAAARLDRALRASDLDASADTVFEAVISTLSPG